MLDDYRDKQSVAYNIFVNEIKNQTISHAYLIDENGYSESFDMVISFVKAILCDYRYTDNEKCGNCSLCKRIDDGNYPEIKIIEPDGMYIKKQQILDLQQEFSRSAIEGKKRIYIIKDADRMRAETANSMLKFLEEPDNNIVAILMTNNYNNILSTIISRCQVIKFNAVSLNNQNDQYVELAVNFIYNVESIGLKTIMDTKELWFNNIGAKDRDLMVRVFDIMIDLYYDILKLKNEINNIRYVDYSDKLKEIANYNSQNNILKKIEYLILCKDSIKLNVNSNLLIDSLVVNIGGSYEGSWS